MPRIRLSAFVVLLGLALGAPSWVLADTLEVRDPDGPQYYRGELTRAYAACLAPNDVTAGGLPACSPVVTSRCFYEHGEVTLQRDGDSRVTVGVEIDNIDGPSCLDGPYTLQLRLRVTADDGTCAGDRCTFEDVVLTQPLSFFGIQDDDLLFIPVPVDELLPIEVRGLHYEVRGAVVTGPDGRPMGATGVGESSAGVSTPMGAGYARCDAPATSGVLGPACAPAWPSLCDTNGGTIAWRSNYVEPSLETRFTRLTGPSAACADGTYVVESTVRLTTVCSSGSACTLPDFPVAIPVTAKRGKIAAVSSLDSLSQFATPMLSMEILDVVVKDPGGALFATAALNDAWDLEKTKVLLQKRDPLSSTDDRLRLEARLSATEIDPTSPAGVRVTLTDRNGPVYDVTIPGSLWQLGIPIGTRWEFSDPAGTTNGVVKASIRLIGEVNGVTTYQLKLEARNVDLGAADLPGINLLIATPPADAAPRRTAQRNRTCKRSGQSFTCK